MEVRVKVSPSLSLSRSFCLSLTHTPLPPWKSLGTARSCVHRAVTVFIIMNIILVRDVRLFAEFTWRGFCAVIRCCGPIECDVRITVLAIIEALVLFFFLAFF